jgi:DNA-binding transcriptional MocR family regulator
MWSPDVRSAAGPIYLAVADALSRDLGSGRVQPGERLPTHRELAERLGVTVGTVTRAYAEARRRGLVSGEVGRGTFARGALPDPVLPRRRDQALVDLALNYPPLSDVEGPVGQALAALKRRGVGHLLGYVPPAGLARHRRAGAEWLGRSGPAPAADDVLVTSGAQHALWLAFAAATEPGDTVLVEAHTYTGMRAVARAQRLSLVAVPMDEHGLRPDGLEAACRRHAARALYLTPTFQNPTATVMPEERRREVARIAARHDLVIVEDDVYALLHPVPPAPITTWRAERSFRLTGLSKSLAPGLRVGYLHGPRELLARAESALMATTTMASPIVAEVAAALIEDGTADAILERRREEAASRQRSARERLGRHVARGSDPGAFHLWLELPDEWRPEELAWHARERGVALTPAEAFAVGREGAARAVRVCVGAEDDPTVVDGALDVIAMLLRTQPSLARPTV